MSDPPRKTGRPSFDMIATLGVLIVAVASLAVAVENTIESRRMVAAESWPFLQFGHGNATDDLRFAITIAVGNSGVGPAMLESLEIWLGDTPLAGSADLLRACCDDAEGTRLARFRERVMAAYQDQGEGLWASSRAQGRVIAAGDEVALLQMRRTPEVAEVWDLLNEARWRLRARACYCSVLGECWVTDFKQLRPTPVDRCETDGRMQYVE